MVSDVNNASNKPVEDKDRRPMQLVRYSAMNRVGEFSLRSGVRVRCGDRVVVQTDRGIELGTPVGSPDALCQPVVPRAALQAYLKTSGPEFCKLRAGRVLRVATDQDINEQTHLDAHIHEDIQHCAGLAAQLNLDMKVITAERLLGGERIVFYFAAPDRVDFRQLVKELAHHHRTRIEMRQVGARDEARLVADYEVCGRECCCKNFLKKLRPVNMKMAKLQKSTLDPTKVSGRCGRLRCCLRYEHEGYEELAKRLPRVNSRVGTADGPATVLDVQVLTQLVFVRTDGGQLVTIPLEEITEFNLPPAPPKPPSERSRKDRDKPAKPADSPDTDDTADDNDADAKSRRRRRRRPRREDERQTDQRADSQNDQSASRDSSTDVSRQEDQSSENAPNEQGDSGTGKRSRRRGRRRRRPKRDRPDNGKNSGDDS